MGTGRPSGTVRIDQPAVRGGEHAADCQPFETAQQLMIGQVIGHQLSKIPEIGTRLQGKRSRKTRIASNP